MKHQSGFERTNPRHDARIRGKGNEGIQSMDDPYNLRPAARIIFWGCVAIAVPLWFALAVWG